MSDKENPIPVIYVDHRCGHRARYKVPGNRTSADREAERRADADCADCRAEAVRAAHAEQNQQSAVKNRDAGLPALRGSEKQVPWAEAIRNKVLPELDQKLERLDPEIASILRAIATRQTRAGWWIDHRDGISPLGLLELDATDDEYDRINHLQTAKAKTPQGDESA